MMIYNLQVNEEIGTKTIKLRLIIIETSVSGRIFHSEYHLSRSNLYTNQRWFYMNRHQYIEDGQNAIFTSLVLYIKHLSRILAKNELIITSNLPRGIANHDI